MTEQKRSVPKRGRNAKERNPDGAAWGDLELYRTIAEHMAEGVSIVVGDERVYVNPAYLRIHGLTEASQALGKSMGLFMDADSGKAMKEARDAQLRGEEVPAALEYRIQRPDGEQRVLEVTPAIITYEGQPATLALIRDVTARTRAAEQLQMGGVVADNMAEGVSVAVGTKRMYVNRAFVEIHGVEDESEVIGQPIDQFIVPEDRKRIVEVWLARQRGEPVPDRVEYRIGRADGVERVVETSTTTITYQDQPAVLGIIRDITERKHAAAALQQSEELYRNVAEKMTEGLAISVDGIRVYVNKALLDIYGLNDPSQLIGKTVEQNLTPEDRQRALDRTLARQRGESLPPTNEYRIQRPNGGERLLEVSTAQIIYQGQSAVLALIRDTTEQKHSQIALQQSEELYRSVAENMTNGVSIAANGIRLYANQAFLDIHGLTKVADVVGKGIELFFTPEHQSAVLERQRMLEAGEGFFRPIDRQIRRPDGQTRDVEVETTPITYLGEPAFLSIYQDVTDRKRAEQEVMASRQQAVEALDALKGAQQNLVQAEKLSAIGQLVAGVAHELNNPLTGVMGFSQLLLGTDISGNVRRDVERISSEAGRAAKIVQNLLSFAHKREPETTPVDLNQVVVSTTEVKAYDLRTSNIIANTDLAAGLPTVLADTSQMQTVLLNLIGNAQDALGHSRGGGALQISTRQVGDVVRVTVADDGPGIRPEHLGKVFDPFFTTKDVGEGTGLGLSICHGIVTAHDGRIWVESEFGQGAAFHMEMPMASGAGSQKGEPENNDQPLSLGGRILVVDDEQVIRYLVVSALSQVGCEVRAAESGRKALELLEQASFDLLIVDMKMPEMSGDRLFQELISTRPEMVERVVFMTGDTVSPDTAKFLDRAGRPTIEKPFSVELLKRLVADELKKTGLT